MLRTIDKNDYFVLRHPTLGWYTGRATGAGEGPEALFSWDPVQAFTYSENGARLKRSTFPCFRECLVEQV